MRDGEEPTDPEDPEEVDKTELEAKITEAEELNEGDYTEESWANLQTVLETATLVLADEDATQADVDEALENLVEAIEGLIEVEDPEDPELVEAIFLENALLRNFGHVKIQVKNIEGAAKYKVQYFLNDKEEGKVETWTKIMNIDGEDYESELIYCMPEDRVAIEIYAEDGEDLLHTFENVELTRQ